MRRRRHVRTLALALTLGGASGLAACDTNDGRDMKEPDAYQAYALENTSPSTTTSTTTIPPVTTPAPSTSAAVAATVADSAEDLPGDTTGGSTVGAADDSAVGSSAATSARPSTSAAPSTTVDPALPVDTFAESLGLANLAADGVDLAGPWPAGSEIPVEYTCTGDEAVPLLTWTSPPAGAVEMALVVIDESADDFAHWIVIGLPPEAGSLGGDEPVVVGSEAMNSVGNIGWAGPCPPDPDVHTYRFTLYALSQAIELPPESSPGDLIQAIEASATGATSFTGTYQVA